MVSLDLVAVEQKVVSEENPKNELVSHEGIFFRHEHVALTLERLVTNLLIGNSHLRLSLSDLGTQRVVITYRLVVGAASCRCHEEL